MTATALLLMDLGVPPRLMGEAREFVFRGRVALILKYGDEAPLSRVEDVLAECLDDPTGVVAYGAADDPLGDLDDMARAFAGLVAASKGGGR